MRKKTGLLFVIKFIKFPVNILNLSLTAKYFGVSIERDMWLLSFTLMTVLDLAIWGPINETFRTKFIFIKEEDGERSAIQKTQSLLFFFAIFSLIIMSIVIFLAVPLAQLIAPKYNKTQINELTRMIRFTAPVLLINQVVQIGISILNAYESFYIPEISGLITSLLSLGLIILLSPFVGIYSLLASYLAASAVLIIIIIIFFKRLHIPVFDSFGPITFDGFKLFFIYAIPFFLPYFFGQINGIIEKSIATTLGSGAVSIIDYSKRLPDMLNAVLISVMLTILVPVLSKKYIQRLEDEYVREFLKIYQFGLIFLTFIISMMMGVAKPLVSILYQKGNISINSLDEIIRLTRCFSWSLFGVFNYIIFGMSMLSCGKNRVYALLGMGTQIVVIILNLVFVKVFGFYIFPLSILISHFCSASLMFNKFPFNKNLVIKTFCKYGLLLFFSSSIMYCLGFYINILNDYFHVLLLLSIQVVVITTLIFLLKLEERDVVNELVAKAKQIWK